MGVLVYALREFFFSIEDARYMLDNGVSVVCHNGMQPNATSHATRMPYVHSCTVRATDEKKEGVQ